MVWLALGWPESECTGRSRHSARCAEPNDDNLTPEELEQEYWVSTKAMLVLFMFWSLFRREMQWRRRCHETGAFIMSVAPPHLFVSMRRPSLTDEQRARCRRGCTELGDTCSCFEGYVADMHKQQADGPVQAAKWAEAMALYACAGTCPAAAVVLSGVVTEVAAILEQCAGAWGTSMSGGHGAPTSATLAATACGPTRM